LLAYDATRKKYLDFLAASPSALGHAHPRIVKVIRREAARAIHFRTSITTHTKVRWHGLAVVRPRPRVFATAVPKQSTAMKLARLCANAQTRQDKLRASIAFSRSGILFWAHLWCDQRHRD
jgi:acetylornithine/succinyldiaminopimelate/putrescine aminotransferase